MLADVFENFRDLGRRTYKLDPAYYLSSPQLSFDAALLHTEAEPELISDTAMYQMIDDGIRGGVAMISTRYARANNPEVEGYDPTKPISWIKGLDANNLYGWSMAQPLPYSDFEWVDQDELTKIDWLAQTVNQEIGYIAKVDLEYQAELHDKHNDYPLVPERIKFQDEWLSETAVNIRPQYKIPRSDCNTKLSTRFRGQTATPSLFQTSWIRIHTCSITDCSVFI